MRRGTILAAAGAAGMAAAWAGSARGADHADALNLIGLPGADINDLYAWGRDGGDRLVLAMSVNRLANHPMFGVESNELDPNVRYGFHVDNGTEVIDIWVQVNDNAADVGRHVRITGPWAEPLVLALDGDGTAEQDGVQVFVGPREDPFFFDLQWFGEFPDDHPLAVLNNDVDFYHGDGPLMNDSPNDTFTGMDVAMIVLEIPAADVTDTTTELGIWASTWM